MSINKCLIAAVIALMLSACVSAPKDNLKEIVAERARAETLYYSGEYEQAIVAYKRLLTLVPGLAETWLKLGNSYSRLQDYPNAIASYDQALLLEPGYVKAWYNLSYVRAQQLAATVVEMYENIPKDDPEALKVRTLVEGVLLPFGEGLSKSVAQPVAAPVDAEPQMPAVTQNVDAELAPAADAIDGEVP